MKQLLTHLKPFIRPTPFWVGIIWILLFSLLWLSFNNKKPPIFQYLDNKIIDIMFKVRGPEESSGLVVIVDIDNRSLAEYGQWPWPRSIMADLVEKIYMADPVIVGFDMVFSEEDRTSPSQVFNLYGDLFSGRENIRQIMQLIAERPSFNHDTLFGEKIGLGIGVLGYNFIFREDFLKEDTPPKVTHYQLQFTSSNYKITNLQLFTAYIAINNIRDLSTATSQGFLNVFPDPDGSVRKMPLLIKMDNNVYPSLGLEMVRIGENITPGTISVREDEKQQKKLLPEKLLVPGKIFQTDKLGQVSINYRGKFGSFLYISASDVLKGTEARSLKNKYVIIGSSTSILGDSVATPFSTRLPLAEVHANFIDNLLQNNTMFWLEEKNSWITLVLFVFAGLLLVISLVFRGPLWGVLSAIAIIIGLLGVSYYIFFLNLKLLNLSYILLALLILFFIVTLSNYIYEGRQRLFIKRTFSRYVSPAIVNEIIRKRKDLDLMVESKNVSVLFCDIRNFTSLSEIVPPQDIGKFLNHYFSLMTKIIINNNGMVDKFIGDAIMAVWGTPLSNNNHADDAVKAASEMLATISQNSHIFNFGTSAIEAGIGINSGFASVGNFGSKNRFDYTVLGDTVNLGARIEDLTKYYQTKLLISEFTKQNLTKDYQCRFIDRVLVKGRNTPVNIYQPLFGKINFISQKELSLYNDAISLYQKQQFDKALAIFNELLQEKPEQLYKIYRKRCRQFMDVTLPKNWTGVHDHN